MRLVLLAVVLLSVLDLSLPARILAVFPNLGKSHFIFLSSVMKTITQAGHEVVEYSLFAPNKPLPNHTHIKIESAKEKLFSSPMSYEDFMTMAQGPDPMFWYWPIFNFGYDACEDTFKNDPIQKLLKSEEHFDLVFTESPFGQESMVVFGQKFKAPVISLQTYSPVSSLNMDAGNALSIAHIPEIFGERTDQLSFSERMTNFIAISLRLLFYYLYALPKHEELIKKYYSQDLPPLVDQISNISLYLVNAHPYIDYIQPYTPNIIPVGGINISPERSLLPQDLQKFMDEAKEGVIYFSLGSVFPTHSMPKEVLQMFVNVFGKLKQRVLWKIETESLPGLSDNVRLTKWVPQPGVLAHRNCVLFITHGGLFSQLEALYAGVPTVGIPLFADQPLNIKFSEYRGFGVKLDLTTLSEGSISTAVNTVLNNPKYRENAKSLSKIFRDRPVSPADSVVFWVEYVLRHAGAHHLRPASTRLSWYQLALLDVLAAVLLPVFIILYILYLFIKRILSVLCCKSNNKLDMKKVSSSKIKKQ